MALRPMAPGLDLVVDLLGVIFYFILFFMKSICNSPLGALRG